MSTRDEVLKAALDLPEGDRLMIATELMDSVPEESPAWTIDDPEFLAELERRSNDGSEGIPWEEVRAQVRKNYGL